MHGMSKCVRPEQIPNNINIINGCLDEIAYTRQASICGNRCPLNQVQRNFRIIFFLSITTVQLDIEIVSKVYNLIKLYFERKMTAPTPSPTFSSSILFLKYTLSWSCPFLSHFFAGCTKNDRKKQTMKLKLKVYEVGNICNEFGFPA